MKKDHLVEKIIIKALSQINLLLPKNKKIPYGKFKIKDNKLFDSLNYITFLIEIDKQYKQQFKTKVNLFNQDPFLDKKHLKSFLLNK